MSRLPPLVLAADDDGYLARLFNRCAEDAGFRTAPPVYSIKELAPKVAEHRPHILILDIRMDGKNSLDRLKSIRRNHPRLRVIVITSYQEHSYVDQALSLGCEGMLWKSDQMVGKLQVALRTVAHGFTYLASEIQPLDTRIHCHPSRPLSEKQYRLFHYLHHWETQARIAKKFRTSARSIELQVRRLRGVLGLDGRSKRVQWGKIVLEDTSFLTDR